MDVTDPKVALHSYLREARAAVLWKLADLSEYDIRRPLTPHGTNLLGLVKHCRVARSVTSLTFSTDRFRIRPRG